MRLLPALQCSPASPSATLQVLAAGLRDKSRAMAVSVTVHPSATLSSVHTAVVSCPATASSRWWPVTVYVEKQRKETIGGTVEQAADSIAGVGPERNQCSSFCSPPLLLNARHLGQHFHYPCRFSDSFPCLPVSRNEEFKIVRGKVSF